VRPEKRNKLFRPLFVFRRNPAAGYSTSVVFEQNRIGASRIIRVASEKPLLDTLYNDAAHVGCGVGIGAHGVGRQVARAWQRSMW
jgi:hypothetical protein